MSNQDMQFADPEWRPPEEREETPELPRPINADRYNQTPWQTPSTSQEEGYLGPGYAASQPQTPWAAPSRPIPRRRSSPWRWLILAFIIIALMSGAFSRSFGGFGGPGPQQSFPKEQVQNFTFNAPSVSTVVITGGTGDITVHTGGAGNSIIIQESLDRGPFGNSGNGIVKPTQSGSTVSVNEDQGSDTSFDITVPAGTHENLQLTTTDGSIQVDSVNGQMTLQSNNGDISLQNSQGPVSLQTNDGSITLSNDELTGSSNLNSQNGDLSFNGTLDSGNYQFQSTNGSVDVTLLNTPNFHLDATTSSGSITTNDFPSIKNTGTQAQGDVGNPSAAKQTTLTLKSNSGDITLHAA